MTYLTKALVATMAAFTITTATTIPALALPPAAMPTELHKPRLTLVEGESDRDGNARPVSVDQAYRIKGRTFEAGIIDAKLDDGPGYFDVDAFRKDNNFDPRLYRILVMTTKQIVLQAVKAQDVMDKYDVGLSPIYTVRCQNGKRGTATLTQSVVRKEAGRPVEIPAAAMKLSFVELAKIVAPADGIVYPIRAGAKVEIPYEVVEGNSLTAIYDGTTHKLNGKGVLTFTGTATDPRQDVVFIAESKVGETARSTVRIQVIDPDAPLPDPWLFATNVRTVFPADSKDARLNRVEVTSTILAPLGAGWYVGARGDFLTGPKAGTAPADGLTLFNKAAGGGLVVAKVFDEGTYLAINLAHHANHGPTDSAGLLQYGATGRLSGGVKLQAGPGNVVFDGYTETNLASIAGQLNLRYMVPVTKWCSVGALVSAAGRQNLLKTFAASGGKSETIIQPLFGLSSEVVVLKVDNKTLKMTAEAAYGPNMFPGGGPGVVYSNVGVSASF